jgi:hypothetical protein
MFLRVAVVTKTKESHKHHGSCMLNERKKRKEFNPSTGIDAYCIMVLIDTFEGTENSRTYATALVNRYASSPRSI